MIVTATLLALAVEVLIGVVLSLLSWDRIKSWFARHAAAFTEDADHIRITLHEKLRTGQHRVVYGIFNTQTSEFHRGPARPSPRM